MPVHSYIKAPKGPRGIADVTLFKTKIQVVLDGKVHEFPREGIPAWVKDGQYAVRLSDDETKLFDILPPGGPDVTYLAVFDSIFHKPGEPFVPGNNDGGPRQTADGKKKWVEPASQTFTSRFRIVGGKYDQALVPFTLRFMFQRYEDTDDAWVVGTGDRSFAYWARQLEDVLRTVGINWDADSIPYDPTAHRTLDYLDRTLRERQVLVQIKVGNGGWVNKVLPAPEGMTYESVVGKAKAKKSSTKSAGSKPSAKPKAKPKK